jgi:eukaryotic-like serine/threonine-protein kinase
VPNVTPLRPEDPDGVGRHRLTGRISGMPGPGPFYLATGPGGSEVTVKLLTGRWTHDAAARDRFAAEAASAQRVPPYCAARILDAGVEDGYAYLVSEYIAGKSLLELVSEGGRLWRLDLEALAIGSATGLASVHEAGLVHGGFGPGHIIMSSSGPRVIEFGIIGPYGTATPAADMLAWAQTMVFAATGRPPATMADLDVLPGSLREAVTDCLTGDPSLRPTARSVVLDLIDSAEPTTRVLAEGARRAAEASYAADEARAERQSSQARGSRGTAGGQPSRSAHSRSAHSRPAPAGGQSRDRRTGALPIAVAVVVIAAVAFVILHVTQSASGGGSSAAEPRPAARPARCRRPSPRRPRPLRRPSRPPSRAPGAARLPSPTRPTSSTSRSAWRRARPTAASRTRARRSRARAT